MTTLIDRIKAKRCPRCGAKRLLAGPAYDRLNVVCCECGARIKFKRKRAT